jgi:mRNA interferase MazF
MQEYDKWNEVKKETVKSVMRLTIKPRDIYWAKIGQNIGHEEYGKGDNFLRPIIVVRQPTSDLFLGVPTTSTKKEDNDYFHRINYKNKLEENTNSSAMLLQLKAFSKKRLLNKIGTVNKDEFKIIIDKLKRLVDPT